MLIFENGTQKALYLHAESAYPEECCGILLGKRRGEIRIAYQAIRAENTGDEKQRATHFSMDPLQIAKIEMSAEQDGLEIVGFYHSHPDYEAVASREDALYMLAAHSYPIVSVKDGVCRQMIAFEKSSSESTEVNKEKIMIQGEHHADFTVHISNTQNLCGEEIKG